MLLLVLLCASFLFICGIATAKGLERREMSRYQHCTALCGSQTKEVRVSASRLPGNSETLRCLVALDPQPWPGISEMTWCDLVNERGRFKVTLY